MVHPVEWFTKTKDFWLSLGFGVTFVVASVLHKGPTWLKITGYIVGSILIGGSGLTIIYMSIPKSTATVSAPAPAPASPVNTLSPSLMHFSVM